MIEGFESRSEEGDYRVIGAHMDHSEYGWLALLAIRTDRPFNDHPGADADNASGTPVRRLSRYLTAGV